MCAGAEKEAVIISMVRSNKEKRVGFCNDRRRMNVVISRAKRHVALIGDSRTLNSKSFLRGLLKHFAKLGNSFGAHLPIPKVPFR